MVESTIKGRATAGAGDPEDLTATQVRTIINVTDGAEPNPTQVSGAEITAGTETALRSYSPADVVDFIDQHETDLLPLDNVWTGDNE